MTGLFWLVLMLRFFHSHEICTYIGNNFDIHILDSYRRPSLKLPRSWEKLSYRLRIWNLVSPRKWTTKDVFDSKICIYQADVTSLHGILYWQLTSLTYKYILYFLLALESTQSELFDVKSKLDEENEARWADANQSTSKYILNFFCKSTLHQLIHVLLCTGVQL